MSKMKEIYEKIIEHLNSLTKEERVKEYEKITHNNFYNRWAEKIHNLSKEERISFINKVKQKYESKEYNDKEYKLGYEPRTELYFIIYRYCENYLEDIIESCNPWETSFSGGIYKIDDTYILNIMYGQGTVINMYTLDEWQKHSDYLKSYINKNI